MKKISFFIFYTLIIVMTSLKAQNTAHFSTYMFNKLYLNPGYAGSHDGINAQATYRSQWSGFEGGPKSIQANVHGSVGKNNAGLGLSILNDQIGAIGTTFITGSYAYKIKLSAKSKGKLAIGISGSLENYSIKYSELRRIDEFDGEIPDGDVSNFKPNLGMGVLYYTSSFYLGLSVPRVLNDHQSGIYDLESRVRHIYLMGGKVFTLTENIKIHPATLFNFVNNAPFEWNMALSLILNDKIYVGANYRLGDSVDGFIRYFITPGFSLTGAYDYTISELAGYVGSSFEVMAEYTFIKKVQGNINIRYF